MAEHGLPDTEQGRGTETGKQKARTAAEPAGNSAGCPAGLLSGFEAGLLSGFEVGLLSGFEVACLECQFYAAQGFFPAQNRGNFAGAAGGCFQPGQGDAYRIQNLSVFQPVGGGDRFQAFKQALVIPAVRTQAFQCRERELQRFLAISGSVFIFLLLNSSSP